ncbi:hypothetical protein Amsp01_090950 [Amycolatopsis sp. NBRC 101858]|uniref:hypothetical protein n=1 Tax=Amycolatopsis sp. NBRC 101858 TaxID=3032200 RepID=UPI0024A3726B|nr:hypothetical protein [Amycolatopsis sp. NBRC 101858]GLY43072.1 hypothetical protein Amsp01_090950 [Amycolatopsis sp. NBRC 101858]
MITNPVQEDGGVTPYVFQPATVEPFVAPNTHINWAGQSLKLSSLAEAVVTPAVLKAMTTPATPIVVARKIFLEIRLLHSARTIAR